MNFNIDVVIFIGFLVATTVIGLRSSRGTNTIEQYAVGDRNFSTPTLVATIVATWISGEFFYSNIYETYTNGLYFIWVVALGNFLCIASVGFLFAPRMGEFLGKLSIAEAMGSLYGDRVRIITAIASFIGTAGLIGIQLKFAGLIFEYALGVPSIYGTLIATFMVTLYASLGGIKSVTFTDVIQFFTFGIAIPLSAYTLFTTVDNVNVIIDTLKTNSLFDYKQVFDFSNPLALKHLFLFLFFIIPDFSPQSFQRIAMAKSTQQVSRSFIIAAITCLFLALMMDWISVITLAINPFLDQKDAFRYVIFNSSYIGLKGAMLAGIMAMIMSTVDSCINSTAVVVVHDFFKPLKMTFIKNEIFAARIISIIIGTASLALSLHEGSLMELLVVTYSFYIPLITAPFIMAIFGFRSSEKSVILGMVAGLTTVIMWNHVFQVDSINSVALGMLANLIFLISSHYLLKQPGGWVGIKDTVPLMVIRNQRKLRYRRFLKNIKSFNLIKICKKNCPKGEGLISMLGLFVMVSAFSSTHTLAKEYQMHHAHLLDILYPITLCASSVLISYPLWLPSWKKTGLICVCWNIIIFSVLICFSLLMVLISNFAEIQLMVFMVNIIMISSLITWQWALFTITAGVAVSSFYYQCYLYVELDHNLLSSQFKIVYLLLLIISTLVAFLKPKQAYQERTEEKVGHLTGRIDSQEKQVQEALALKAEFIRNMQHEHHAPMTGVISMSEGLQEAYDKLNDKQRKDAINAIVKSAHSLKSLEDNLTTLTELSKPHYELKKEDIDFSELVYNRVHICRKLYEKNKEDREFILDIAEGIVINADKGYMTQLLDNLIINTISYCKKGQIRISLSKDIKNVHLSFTDEGIGIPKAELFEIFEPFTVSSKTHTPAGGRGVGLAICRRILEVHDGTVKAESDGGKGATFIVVLPRSK